METTEINSISDLSKILQTPGEPEKGHTRFFRGHADKDWEIVPGIYRKDRPYLIENEYRMIKDVIINCPNDFPPNSTLFERLVRLQHYKYRTRLIDITTNALVALYFATLPYINPNNRKHPCCLKMRGLSNLARTHKTFSKSMGSTALRNPGLSVRISCTNEIICLCSLIMGIKSFS